MSGTTKKLAKAAAVLAPLKVERNEKYPEVESVTYAGKRIFWRDDKGRPWGIFPRWIRGARRE